MMAKLDALEEGAWEDVRSPGPKKSVQGTVVKDPVTGEYHLKKDEDEVEKRITLSKPSGKILTQQLKTTQADLSAVIPAKAAAVVRLSCDAKNAEVKLKITN